MKDLLSHVSPSAKRIQGHNKKFSGKYHDYNLRNFRLLRQLSHLKDFISRVYNVAEYVNNFSLYTTFKNFVFYVTSIYYILVYVKFRCNLSGNTPLT